MAQIERILCPVDFSDSSAIAFDYAQSLAWHYRATLLLQHVMDSMAPFYPYNVCPDAYDEMCRNLRAGAERQLQEFAEKHTQHGILPQCHVADGNVTDLILSFAGGQAVNLIVMGTHGLRGIDHLMVGSVTEKVLRKARCPVLAVRKPAHGFAAQAEGPNVIQLYRVLCCTDSLDRSDLAWDHAVSIAEEYGAGLTLLHILEEISSSSDIENETAKVLELLEKRIQARPRKNGITKAAVRIGKAYQQVIQFALESRTDVAIMGARGRHSLDRAVFGSTTYRVVQLGPCPVLVVHS